jgi:hypothetical protein
MEQPPCDWLGSIAAPALPVPVIHHTLWQLIPVDLQAAAWQATTYKGPVVVRAASEQQARELACADFSVASLPVATTIDPPWTQPGVVRAESVEDNLRYSATGGPEILELS